MPTNEEVVLEVIKAVEERDREKLLSLYHEDVAFHEAESLPYGGVSQGKAFLAEQLENRPEETWLGTWDWVQPTDAARRFEPRVVASVGDEVVVQYTQRAVSPDGERFEAPVVALYEVRDGKFARAQMFHYDTASILGFLDRARNPAGKAAA